MDARRVVAHLFGFALAKSHSFKHCESAGHTRVRGQCGESLFWATCECVRTGASLISSYGLEHSAMHHKHYVPVISGPIRDTQRQQIRAPPYAELTQPPQFLAHPSPFQAL